MLCAVLSGCAAPPQAVVWELNHEAQLTYAILLLDQSIRTDSASGVIEATETLLDAGQAPLQPLIEAGSWLLLNKEPATARLLLQRAIAQKPEELTLHMLLAEAWLDEGQADKAVEVLETFKKRYPESMQIQQELGILLYKVKRYKEADDVFSKLSARLVTPYTRLCHAHALMELGQPRAAVKQLSIALAAQPDSDEIREVLAGALVQTGDTAKARALYRDLLDKSPENAELRLRFMRMEIAAARPQAALRLAREGKSSHSFCLSAASLFLDTGRFSEAETFLRELLTAPNAPDVYKIFLAATVFEGRGDTQQAFGLLENIADQSPMADRVIYLKAQMLIMEKNWSQAIRLLEDGLKRYPDNPDFFTMLADAYVGAKDTAAARRVMDKAAATHPEDMDILFIQATTYDLDGDQAGALAIMERIITIDPNYYRALNYIGFKLADTPSDASPEARKADLNRALILLRKAVSLAPDKAYILDSLAWAQFRSGQLELAWENIRATVAMKGGATEAEIWAHYGDIAHSLGKTKEARRGWEKALALNPRNSEELRGKLNLPPAR